MLDLIELHVSLHSLVIKVKFNIIMSKLYDYEYECIVFAMLDHS